MNWRIRGGYDVGTQFFNQVGFPCCTVPLNRMPGQTCLLTFYHPAPQFKCVPRPRHPPCLRLEGQADGIEVITFFACIFNECPAQALGSTTKRIGKVGKLIPPPCEGLIFPGIKMHCRPAKIRQPSKIVKIYIYGQDYICRSEFRPRPLRGPIRWHQPVSIQMGSPARRSRVFHAEARQGLR